MLSRKIDIAQSLNFVLKHPDQHYWRITYINQCAMYTFVITYLLLLFFFFSKTVTVKFNNRDSSRINKRQRVARVIARNRIKAAGWQMTRSPAHASTTKLSFRYKWNELRNPRSLQFFSLFPDRRAVNGGPLGVFVLSFLFGFP